MDVLHRSCFHKCPSSFLNQIEHLKSTEYPQSVIPSVAKGVLKTFEHGCLNAQTGAPQKEGGKKENGAVVPYIHDVSHRFKKIRSKDVRVVVSVPNWLSSLCKASYHQAKKAGCRTKHRESFVECANNVVFALPLKCGKKVHRPDRLTYVHKDAGACQQCAKRRHGQS